MDTLLGHKLLEAGGVFPGKSLKDQAEQEEAGRKLLEGLVGQYKQLEQQLGDSTIDKSQIEGNFYSNTMTFQASKSPILLMVHFRFGRGQRQLRWAFWPGCLASGIRSLMA